MNDNLLVRDQLRINKCKILILKSPRSSYIKNLSRKKNQTQQNPTTQNSIAGLCGLAGPLIYMR